MAKMEEKLDIKNCFLVDKNDGEILKILARFGPLNTSQIVKHSTLTRKKVEYSITKHLLKNNFLKIHSERLHRNIKHAFGDKKVIVKEYTLTEKGWYSSIDLNSIEDNYYLNFHMSIYPTKIQKILREHTKVKLQLLALNLNIFNIKLDQIENFDWMIQDMLTWEYAHISEDSRRVVSELETELDNLAGSVFSNQSSNSINMQLDRIVGLKDISLLEELPSELKPLKITL